MMTVEDWCLSDVVVFETQGDSSGQIEAKAFSEGEDEEDEDDEEDDWDPDDEFDDSEADEDEDETEDDWEDEDDEEDSEEDEGSPAQASAESPTGVPCHSGTGGGSQCDQRASRRNKATARKYVVWEAGVPCLRRSLA